MKRLTSLLESLRHLSRSDPKHKQAMRHIHHALHTAYLSCYVCEWHLPMSLLCLGLLAFVLMSWVWHISVE